MLVSLLKQGLPCFYLAISFNVGKISFATCLQKTVRMIEDTLHPLLLNILTQRFEEICDWFNAAALQHEVVVTSQCRARESSPPCDVMTVHLVFKAHDLFWH